MNLIIYMNSKSESYLHAKSTWHYAAVLFSNYTPTQSWAEGLFICLFANKTRTIKEYRWWTLLSCWLMICTISPGWWLWPTCNQCGESRKQNQNVSFPPRPPAEARGERRCRIVSGVANVRGHRDDGSRIMQSGVTSVTGHRDNGSRMMAVWYDWNKAQEINV